MPEVPVKQHCRRINGRSVVVRKHTRKVSTVERGVSDFGSLLRQDTRPPPKKKEAPLEDDEEKVADLPFNSLTVMRSYRRRPKRTLGIRRRAYAQSIEPYIADAGDIRHKARYHRNPDEYRRQVKKIASRHEGADRHYSDLKYEDRVKIRDALRRKHKIAWAFETKRKKK